MGNIFNSSQEKYCGNYRQKVETESWVYWIMGPYNRWYQNREEARIDKILVKWGAIPATEIR